MSIKVKLCCFFFPAAPQMFIHAVIQWLHLLYIQSLTGSERITFTVCSNTLFFFSGNAVNFNGSFGVKENPLCG